jgi:hypothetical protein
MSYKLFISHNKLANASNEDKVKFSEEFYKEMSGSMDGYGKFWRGSGFMTMLKFYKVAIPDVLESSNNVYVKILQLIIGALAAIPFMIIVSQWNYQLAKMKRENAELFI